MARRGAERDAPSPLLRALSRSSRSQILIQLRTRGLVAARGSCAESKHKGSCSRANGGGSNGSSAGFRQLSGRGSAMLMVPKGVLYLVRRRGGSMTTMWTRLRRRPVTAQMHGKEAFDAPAASGGARHSSCGKGMRAWRLNNPFQSVKSAARARSRQPGFP